MSAVQTVPVPAAEPSGGLMSLQEHLGELRNRILRSLGWVLAGWFLCLWQWEPIFHWLKGPLEAARLALPEGTFAGFATTQAQGGLVQIFRVATAGAIVVASPLILGELWGFLAPGLTRKERAFAGPLLPVVALLFFAGCAFAYYVLIPPMISFMLEYNAKIVTFQPIEIAGYLALVTNIMIALGVAFQVPVLTFLLARLGLVTAGALAKWRRHAIVAVAILAALITPTPDAFNMLLLAIPLYILYEVSVLVAYFSFPRKPAA